MGPKPIVFLGPQRRAPTVLAALRSLRGLDPRAPVAIISAGWEERESEIQEFEQHVGVRAFNLEVFRRVEQIYTRDPALREATRKWKDRMRALQEVYRDRLAHALDAARDLLAREGEAWLLDPERDAAIEAVRALDQHHFERVRRVHAEFTEEHRLSEHALVAPHREELGRILEHCAALCIAGGHVGILLNRLRVLDLLPLWRGGPILAWGAGAMALTDRVVLFHDNPPQGAGNAEVLDAGLGLAPAIVPLPHASARLRLDDPSRVRLFAHRFGPARCVALDEGARVDWDGERWRGHHPTRQLVGDGTLAEVLA